MPWSLSAELCVRGKDARKGVSGKYCLIPWLAMVPSSGYLG